METIHRGKWQDETRFEKPLPHGWFLRKLAHAGLGSPPGKGCYWDEHELVHSASELLIPCPAWEWAEWDRNRIVWAADGRLEAARLTEAGLTDPTVLCDLNGLTFTPLKAPY